METKTGAHESTPANFETQGKDSHFLQLQKTQVGFFSDPSTMLMVAKKTGIERASICRYCATLRKEGALWIVKIGRCPISGYPRVNFYTTDPRLVENQPKQLTLF